MWDAEKNTIEIDKFLTKYQDFLKGRPFWEETLSWEEQYPELSRFLRSWTPEEVEHFERCPHLHPKSPSILVDIFESASVLTELPILYEENPSLPRQLSYNIKGRKWAQITHLISVMNLTQAGIVDWCCGKGHLGRTLSRVFDVPLQGLDLDKELIEQARELSTSLSQHQFTQCDVLQGIDFPVLQGTIVALHSCGDLLDRAIKTMLEQQLQQGIFVSCCYHRIQSLNWIPKSQKCAKQHVKLDRFELRIPSTFEHSASAKIRRRRRREMLYRVSFDLLIRDILGNQKYQQFPSVPDKWKDISFEEFAQNISKREHILIPQQINLNQYLEKGQKKLIQIRGLASLRSLFSRLIELLVIGDRTLWLQEQGREAIVGLFAPEEVTPRNITIVSS